MRLRNFSWLLLVGLLLGGQLLKAQVQDHKTSMSDKAMEQQERADWAIALHGGAGVILRERMSEAYENEVHEVLAKALDTGIALLDKGIAADSVVQAVIQILEDDEHFNAGRGAVFTYEGRNELDASIMRGEDLMAGAVSGVVGVRNPIALARAVMVHSPHVMLSGEGAEDFARQQGLRFEEEAWFTNEMRKKQWKEARDKSGQAPMLSEDGKFGTVGCVVLDRAGHLAAGTSTGGMTLKRYGRIGDSPIIGAGTYADDRSCAVSATGHGEYFIRYAVAHEISARMRIGNQSLEQASDEVINQVLKAAGGDGGVVAVDRLGHISMPFNTPGMYRAAAKPGLRTIGIFGDE